MSKGVFIEFPIKAKFNFLLKQTIEEVNLNTSYLCGFAALRAIFFHAKAQREQPLYYVK